MRFRSRERHAFMASRVERKVRLGSQGGILEDFWSSSEGLGEMEVALRPKTNQNLTLK